jgi:hypothetical protein
MIFGIGHLLWVGMGYAWMKLVRRRSAFGGTLQLSCFITNAEEFRESWMHSFSNWLALLVILYNALCTLLFQAFMCMQLPDGTHVLQVDPDQVPGARTRSNTLPAAYKTFFAPPCCSCNLYCRGCWSTRLLMVLC